MTDDAARNGSRRDPVPGREPPLAAAARRLAEARGDAPPPTGPGRRSGRPATSPAATSPAATAPPVPAMAGSRQWGSTSLPAAPRPYVAPTWTQAPPTVPSPSEPPYSRWWKRACASLIDWVVLSVPSGIIVALAGGNRVETDPVTGVASVRWTGALVAAYLLTFVGSLAYHVILEGGRGGATVGKMALNISVRDQSTLGPIGYPRALGRRLMANLLWLLLVVPGILDLLAPLWSSRRQTWHDNVVGSVVVDKA